METKSAFDTRPNLTKETVFHAVYIPQDNNNKESNNTKECIHIYKDMAVALKIIKEHKENKGVRLKTFKNYSDATDFVTNGEIEFGNNHCAAASNFTMIEEKSSDFKTPKPQELVGFRKLIECGDIESIRNTVWTNPRYLISNGVTPTILHIGTRYNALHVAVKANKPDICEFILKTVNDPVFIQFDYEDDEYKSGKYVDAAHFMLDSYLNTPDKGLHETPLHFAAKFGYKNIVMILVSYTECNKILNNKYNQSPIDIICTRRYQGDESLKQEIRMLLEDQFYVPVLRAEDNTCQPIIGEPFSPSSPLINSDNLINKEIKTGTYKKNPISPCLKIHGFAGPMTKPQAEEFRKKWKTPPRITLTLAKRGQGDTPNSVNSPIANLAKRLKDTEKGLESVGRDLAEECKVSWKEYWHFLNDFVDLRCNEGLTKLETYLEQKYNDYDKFAINKQLKKLVSLKKRNRINTTNVNAPTDCRASENMNAMDSGEIQDLCEKLRLCSLNTKDDENKKYLDNLEFFTPPSSPEPVQSDSDDEMHSAEEEGPTIFIEGISPTKLDNAVYMALSSEINPYEYPCVYHWRHGVQLAIKRDPSRFNNTRSLRRKLFTNH